MGFKEISTRRRTELPYYLFRESGFSDPAIYSMHLENVLKNNLYDTSVKQPRYNRQ